MPRKKKDSLSDSEQIVQPEKRTMKNPKICLFDFDESTVQLLQNSGFNISTATLGTPVQTPDKHNNLFLLNHEGMSNVHECDIFIIDMGEKNAIPYNASEHTRDHHDQEEAGYFRVDYPQTVFDPRACAAKLLRDELSKIKERTHIKIVFASEHKRCSYNFILESSQGRNRQESYSFDNYDFLNANRLADNICGEEIENEVIWSELGQVLEKFKTLFRYEVTFKHPTKWIDSQHMPIKSFIPLLINKNKEIISYVEFFDDSIVLVLPQMNSQKEQLLRLLLEEILPSMAPSIFPESTLFAWKHEPEYWLPNHGALHQKKVDLEKSYLETVETIENEIEKNTEAFSYLHDLLTQTDDELVNAVVKYLKWLGFERVRTMDIAGELKEEDIQIELDDGILIIEVKGIGGTSKDSDCNQINKVKHRRCKERNAFDVSALYLVNHQKHLPPHQRRNPPFSDQQIADAENEERGLLTTWELFKCYYLIENGIFNKGYVRKKILECGLITFAPDEQQLLGKAEELLKENTVLILTLNGACIKKDSELIIEHDGEFQKVTILNLQQDDVDVNEASLGEVGILIDKPIKRNAKVFLDFM